MPIQADILNGTVVSCAKGSSAGFEVNPDQESDPNDDVECVHTGHHEIQPKEGLGVSGDVGVSVVFSGKDPKVEFVCVFEVFDDAKGECKTDGKEKVNLCPFFVAGLCGAHSERHRQAAGDEENGVECAHTDIEVFVCSKEGFGVKVTQGDIGHKEATKEEDFLRDKDPHPQLRRGRLLSGRMEVVMEMRWVFGVCVIGDLTHSMSPKG